MAAAPRLLIVYNAEEGVVAGVKDSLHKWLKPETYPCRLCAVTHGLVRMDAKWKRFLARVPLEVRVYHRPDFRSRYPALDVALPAVLVEHGREAEVLIGADALAGIDTVDALIAAIEARLAA